MVCYFFPQQTAGCYLKQWLLKAELFSPWAEAKMLSHLKQHSSFNALIWWTAPSLQPGTTERKKKVSRSPWKPQKKRQICPRPRHSTSCLPHQAPKSANVGAGNSSNSWTVKAIVEYIYISVTVLLRLNELQIVNAWHKLIIMEKVFQMDGFEQSHHESFEGKRSVTMRTCWPGVDHFAPVRLLLYGVLCCMKIKSNFVRTTQCNLCFCILKISPLKLDCQCRSVLNFDGGCCV